MKLLALACDTCGASFEPNGPIQDYCRVCGPQFGTLECMIDLKNAAREFASKPLKDRPCDSILRYEPLLPFSDKSSFPPLRIGRTPGYCASRLADATGIREIWIKDDGLNPSGSYKDRASAMVTARAKELKYPVIACASTGNAAASLACCCAASGIACVVFVPASAPAAKLTQIAAFGAILVSIRGTYDQAFDLVAAACEKYEWFNRSAGLNPYLVEGKKTGAFELCEDTNFNPPEVVFVGAGDGSIITGLCKGFTEFKKLGFIKDLPRIYGVQAEGASALKRAYDQFLTSGMINIEPGSAQTCADSISVGNPREGVRAIKAVKAAGGAFLTVDEAEIRSAIGDLARTAAVFSEPAGAVGLAGLKRALRNGLLSKGSRAGIFVTGSGLKDISGVRSSLKMEVLEAGPSISEIEKLDLKNRIALR
jgi:threonine synthase